MTPKTIPLRQLRHHWAVYWFALPAVLFIGLFQYYPAASGIYHSFFYWNGADIKDYVGLENYRQLLSNPEFWHSFRVALLIGLWNVAKMVPAVVAAVCIHRCTSERAQWFYRVLFVAPMVVPSLVVVLIWRSFFFEATQGFLNGFLFSTGLFDVLVWADRVFGLGGIFLEGVRPAWLGDGRLLLVACVVWGFPWVGSFAVLTHIAKLGNIPKDLYEAADLDGVTWWTRFTRVELPLMSGSIGIVLVFVIIDTIKDAGMILALAGVEGGPGGIVTVPALFMLRKAFVEQQMGAACAVGVVLTVTVMVLKKLLDGVGQWETLKKPARLTFRIGGALAAVGAYVVLGSPALAFVLVVAVVPWAALYDQTVGRLRARLAGAQSGGGVPRSLADSRAGAAALWVGRHGFIWAVLAMAYLPMYLMLVVSGKTNTQFYDAPATVTTPFHWANWAAAAHAILPAVANSVFVTATSTVLTILLALGGAYFFARVRVPGSAFLWNALLVLMMMPTIANLVPLFRLLGTLDLVNTLTALIVVGAAGGQAFAIFVLRGFVADIPQDLFEAAEIDGAGHGRQMFTIVLPLAGPILGVIGVMHAIGQWNDFVLPLIVIRDESRLPVMVQLLRMAGEYVKLWGPLMAGYALASIPVIVLFIASMKLFARGLTEGAVKG